MAGPVQGMVSYDFKEAIDILSRSMADAATLAARWYDICDTTTEKDVTIGLSSGESMTVPNLGKAIAALLARSGKIDATQVDIKGTGHGMRAVPNGTDVYTALAKDAVGSPREQHAYTTPYNVYTDACIVSASAECVDRFDFMAIPRALFFNDKSSLDGAGYHALVLRPLTKNSPFMPSRNDAPCLATRMTLVNGDRSRVAGFLVMTDAAGSNTVLNFQLAPLEHAELLVWGVAGESTCNVMRL